MPVSMFTMKIESSKLCERIATSPSAARIENIAISSGTTPATTAPKTSSRMIRAAGSPNWSSPSWRSRSESRLKSWSSTRLPATATAKSGSRSVSSTISITMPAASSLTMFSSRSVACPSSETRLRSCVEE